MSRLKAGLGGAAVLVMLALPACSQAAAPGNPSPVVTAPAAAPVPGTPAAPRLVTATPAGGSPGKGPLVITSPASLPGGKPGSQRVVLGDRLLEISGVAERQVAGKGMVLIDLNLTVRNLSKKPIRNDPAFYELIGPGGDTFSYQDNSSDAFYGAVAAHAARSGMIEFEVPAAAAPGLYLMYRPEIPAEAVLTRLKPA